MPGTFHKPGRWLRVNTHSHTTHSDGAYAPAQAIAHYQNLGYQALAITDHRVATPTDGLAGADGDFTVIPGVEIDGVDPETGLYHLVGLGVSTDQDFGQDTPLQQAVDWVNTQGGLAIFAHPYWTGQRHAALTSVRGAVGVEVYNHVCHMHNGKPYSLSHWDALLEERQRVWGIASDDTHYRPQYGFGGSGWIMVRAAANTTDAILAAIRAGDFYASTAPQIHSVQRDGQVVSVKCSPVVSIAFTGQQWRGGVVRPPEGQETITEARYVVTEERFIRVTCTDAAGRKAWSQPIFFDD